MEFILKFFINAMNFHICPLKAAAVACSPIGYMLGRLKLGEILKGKAHHACVGAWHGAWLADVVGVENALVYYLDW